MAKPRICYTGIGAHPSGNHTPTDFVRRVKSGLQRECDVICGLCKSIASALLCRTCKSCKAKQKKRATYSVNDWVRWSGANWGPCK